jgi:hypothetical protein
MVYKSKQSLCNTKAYRYMKNKPDGHWEVVVFDLKEMGSFIPALGTSMGKKVWMGSFPSQCDICQSQIGDSFVDGATYGGPWAIMCLACLSGSGRGLGTGRGQRYDKGSDGEFVKVKG